MNRAANRAMVGGVRTRMMKGMKMEMLENPWRGAGFPGADELEAGGILSDPASVEALYARCPVAAPTPLRESAELGAEARAGRLFLKDERGRMGLGSFKALGAAHAIAKLAAARPGAPERALEGEVFVCASAGNHGLSVAAGARVFGARAVIFLARTVPESFAARLRERGAEVVREGENYEAAMAAAMAAAAREGWRLLSDSSWRGYAAPARDVMEGYLIMAAEAAAAIPAPPSHLFIQAGVGGIAAAIAVHARRVWGAAPRIVVVEPEAAPALIGSIRAGRLVDATGPDSSMGRLDCKTPSHLALIALAAAADGFMTISDAMAEAAAARLGAAGLPTTPSGAAGLAGLLAAGGAFGVTRESSVLLYLTEAAES
ncbi:pyridoxal-phosphate dependent enzyme [Paludibacillus litoralis]|uniref:pyridoxal-phosphate dependent enzyme n=1 Tax=Paludibacillus litoralis TaxID=3133267 RepID=UPI0039B76D05